MRTILITGGTSGIGKGLAMHYLNEGDRVIVVGSSTKNGDLFRLEAEQLSAETPAIYKRADLSLVSENRRIVEEIKEGYGALDAVIFCAAKHSRSYTETPEGLETTFALAYLSRFILSYELAELLEKADNPVIINVCAPGMEGEVNWTDLQHKNDFKTGKVAFHSSRLNDLLGVSFSDNNAASKIRYILYNPWAVRTSGVTDLYSNPLLKAMLTLSYRFIAKPVDEAIKPIIELLNSPPKASLSAYREEKPISLEMDTYNPDNAVRLHEITTKILQRVSPDTA
jgi:NAD(P)-dependent dehydrogenase (short-subunit alcohol dehydrogenase family)